MKDLEKQIEEAAKLSFSKQIDPETSSCECFFHYTDELLYSAGFREGVKSSKAKEYWQQGMYSEEEVRKIALYAAEHAQDYHMKFPYEWFDEWFEQNKKK